MKLALARAGLFFSGSAAIEAILIMCGVIRVGDAFINNDDFIQAPFWVIVATPVLIGLVLFFYTWVKYLEAEQKRAEKADKKD